MKNNSKITVVLLAVSLLLLTRCGNPERDKIIVETISLALSAEVSNEMIYNYLQGTIALGGTRWQAESIEKLEIIEIVKDQSNRENRSYWVTVNVEGTCRSSHLEYTGRNSPEWGRFKGNISRRQFGGEACFKVVEWLDDRKLKYIPEGSLESSKIFSSKETSSFWMAQYSGEECQD